MGLLVRGFLAVGLLVGAAGVAHAGCGKNPGDNQAVIDARAAAEQTCNCASSQNHGTYVSCVAGVAKQRALDGLLPKNCAGKVKKCAAKSTCGKPGFVTCCVTSGNKSKCKLKKSVEACTAKHGTVNANPSCCSAAQPLTTDSCNSPSGAFLDAASF
jgi:hypothetical protein